MFLLNSKSVFRFFSLLSIVQGLLCPLSSSGGRSKNTSKYLFLGPKSCHAGDEALQGLMKYFPGKEIHELKALSVSLYKNPTIIASLSKYVFAAAEEQNPVAIDILKKAFESLTDLYATLWKNIGSPTEEIPVFLNGGIFENKNSLDLLKTAIQSRKDIITNPSFILVTHENHATYVVRKLLSTKI